MAYRFADHRHTSAALLADGDGIDPIDQIARQARQGVDGAAAVAAQIDDQRRVIADAVHRGVDLLRRVELAHPPHYDILVETHEAVAVILLDVFRAPDQAPDVRPAIAPREVEGALARRDFGVGGYAAGLAARRACNELYDRARPQAAVEVSEFPEVATGGTEAVHSQDLIADGQATQGCR